MNTNRRGFIGLVAAIFSGVGLHCGLRSDGRLREVLKLLPMQFTAQGRQQFMYMACGSPIAIARLIERTGALPMNPTPDGPATTRPLNVAYDMGYAAGGQQEIFICSRDGDRSLIEDAASSVASVEMSPVHEYVIGQAIPLFIPEPEKPVGPCTHWRRPGTLECGWCGECTTGHLYREQELAFTNDGSAT